MKKLILVLAIALVASPALAALDVNLVLIDSDTVEVRYTGADVDNLPRAFALDLTIAGGTFDSIGSYKTGESTSASKGYGIYPATIDINSAGVVADDGDPIAPSTDPGATGTGTGTNRVILEFASLYYGDGNAPATSGTLCQLDFTAGTATQIVMVEEETYRGGIVLEDGSLADANDVLPLASPDCLYVGKVFSTTCGGFPPSINLTVTQVMVDRWVTLGKPAVWCCEAQKCGNVANNIANARVDVADVAVIKGAWLKSIGQAGYNAAGDVNLSGRVDVADLGVVKAHWLKNVGLCLASY